MAQKSTLESSDSDWCFVPPEDSLSLNGNAQSSNNELKSENQAAADNQDNADDDQDKCCADDQNVKPSEVLNDDSRSASLGDHELSEDNTDSSSDVEILEESAGPDLLESSIDHIDASVSFHGGSLSRSVAKPSDSTPTESQAPLPETFTLPRTLNTIEIDKKVEAPRRRRAPSDRPKHSTNYETVIKWLRDQYDVNYHNMFLVGAIFFSIIAVYQFICLVTYPTESSLLETPLNEIQSSIVQCFGEQHLEGLRRGDERFLNLPVCAHNIGKYNNTIKGLLDLNVKSFLLTGIQEPDDEFYVAFENDHYEIHLDTIISQLQFMKLLPAQEPILEFDDIMKSLLTGKKMALDPLEGIDNEMTNSEQSKLFKTDDLVVAKDPVYESSTNGHYKNIDLDSYSKLMRDLNAEISFLNFEKLKLQKKIDESQETCTSQASCSTSNKVKNPRAAETQAEKTREKSSPEQDTAEKIKPYLDDLASVLSSEILNLHKSLVNELKEVKKWNELLQNLTMEARNSSPQSEGGTWSWKEIRQNVENIVLEAHQDFKDKLSAFQIQNFTETVQNIVEDNKKNAEYLLNVVNNYFNAVKEKTQNILETPLPEIEVDSTVKGFWNVMDNLQAKWHYIKKEVKQMARKFHPEKQHKTYYEDKDKNDFETNSENWYFKRFAKKTNDYNDYEMHAKSDWLFKRAAQRARHHRKIAKDHKKYA